MAADGESVTPLIVIQARLGSKRLPSKVLLPLGGKPVLQHVVERCQKTGYPVVVAVPANELMTGAFACGIPCGFYGHPGDTGDVLARYATLVGKWDAITARTVGVANPPTCIVRITADCPLVDPVLIEASVQAIRDGADYAGNTVERHWPRGCDVESFTTELLLQAHQEATDSYDREHVTPWMQRWASTPVALKPSIRPVEARTEWRWTLDRQSDLTWLRGLYEQYGDPSLEQAAAYSRLYPPPVD